MYIILRNNFLIEDNKDTNKTDCYKLQELKTKYNKNNQNNNYEDK